MKKILMIIGTLMMVACASEPAPTKYYRPQVDNSNCCQSSLCNGCSRSYTVRKPVEVLYKDTTYTTVYEPKTYESVNYVRKPFNGCESDLCR